MKYQVWVKERAPGAEWEDCGEGPLTQAQAERIARELRQDTGCLTKIMPAEE